jgi:hypothetical protein
MPDSIMYQQEDCFVVLESDREEEFFSKEELKQKLEVILQENTEDIPREIAKIAEIDRQVEHLLDNYYELNFGEGKYIQWYVVRLEK